MEASFRFNFWKQSTLIFMFREGKSIIRIILCSPQKVFNTVSWLHILPPSSYKDYPTFGRRESAGEWGAIIELQSVSLEENSTEDFLFRR